MHVTVRRSGGFAGTTETLADVEASSLTAAAAATLADAVKRSAFFDLPPEIPGDVGGDLFRYEVTVSDAGRSKTVATSGEPRPGTPLRAILDAVV
jgi:hypothetical protein